MQIKKMFAFLFTLFLVLSSAVFAQTPPPAADAKTTPVAKPEPLPADTLDAIRERGKLRVCISPYAPWVMIGKDGTYSGFSIDLSKQLAKDLDVDVEFVGTGYPDLIPELFDGHCDLIPAGLSATPDRALFVHFSDLVAHHGIFVVDDKKSKGTYNKLEDFNQSSVTLGAVAASAELEDAKRIFPNAKIVEFPGQIELVEALTQGKIQSIVAANPLPEIIFRTTGDQFYLPLKDPITDRGESFAVRRGDVELLAYLNSWIQAHTYDTWLSDRSDYWFKNLTWMK
jgi:polar amino acid transport system substrate-binding protein